MARKDHMLYRMAYRMAMADGELSANEALILHLFQDNLKVGREELQRLREEALELDWSSLPGFFPERKDQLELFETACLMAMIDGRSDLQEWDIIMRLCETFGIDRPEAQESLARARARLNALAEQHNLLPEILANLRAAEAEEAAEAGVGAPGTEAPPPGDEGSPRE